jgi:hypothetical protein
MRFRRGVQLYEDGDYQLALIEFTKAYELAPSYRLLYNIGQVQVELAHYAAAIKSLKSYLDQGGSDIPPDERSRVDRQVESLRRRTATVSIRISVAGASVELDEQPLPQEQAITELVDGGEHRLRVTKAGFLPYQQRFTVGGGDVTDVSVVLTPQPVEEPRTATAQSHPEVWASWLTTGAFGAGTLICGLIALNYNSKLTKLRDELGSSDSERQSAGDRARTFGYVTDGLAIATAAGAAVSVYLTVRASGQPAARIGIAPDGVRLSGSF